MIESIETIYDIEKHIDLEYINRIIQNNLHKKIICFGGGTAADILMKKVLFRYEVYCFLDNNSAIQGAKIHSIEIKSPDVLQELESNSYFVLILSKHVVAISRQLEKKGLEKDKDYFDIYNKFLPYFRIKKFVKYASDFETFINKIPDGVLERIPIKNTQKIGIVCIAEMIKLVSWYPIAQCILLRYRGYNSSLVIDCLHNFDDYIYFDGITEIASIYIDYIVKKVQEKWPSFEAVKIDSLKQAALDNDDINMTKKYAPIVLKWLDSRKDEVFFPEDESRLLRSENILKNTMKYIKAFFTINNFDVINVYTGIHRHRCIYTYIGEKLGMRVTTYDGDDIGVTLNETEGVSGWSYDVCKIIEGDYFSKEEKQHLVEISKQNFKVRRNSTIKDVGYNYQKVKSSIITNVYDVIIPLNIMWDSAALGLDYIFKDEIEWLQKTLRFLIDNTDVTIMVREHPAQRVSSEYYYKDYKSDLAIIDEYPERIRYVDANADINTYQYIEKCKLVLPYTSTIGLESIMMGKPIVLHTKVYYSKYIGQPSDETAYFNKILEYLTDTSKNVCCNDCVYLAYLFQMCHAIRTQWSECFDGWLKNDLEEVNKLEGVDEILDIIISGTPAIYHNIHKLCNTNLGDVTQERSYNSIF